MGASSRLSPKPLPPPLPQALDLAGCPLQPGDPPPPAEGLGLRTLVLPSYFAVQHSAWLAGLCNLRALGLVVSNQQHHPFASRKVGAMHAWQRAPVRCCSLRS